ncbi:MAG TPA: DUF1102 domain-containing protein [Methanomicrobia archaeon]|nr:DUF1102 domain-containing protein [Methanomicrobia archaeon]
MMKKLIPLFGILLAAIVVMSTGAFTSVTADREATISVTGDADALLALNPVTDGEYATITDGKLVIDATLGAQNGATGVNPDAVTDLGDVFTITNNGTQTVNVTLSKSVTGTDVYTFSSDDGDLEGDGVSLASGVSTTVSIQIDTTGSIGSGDSELTGITITATAN